MIKAVSLIVNNRTGIREIQLNMDTVLKNDELRYEFFLGNSAKIMTVSYSRNGKKEEINQVMSAFVFLLAVVGISVKPVFRKKLIGIQEEYVREIFPFIFKYPGMQKFRKCFENEYFKEVIYDANYQKMMEKDGEESYCICAPTSKELVYAGQRLHNCLKDYGKKITEDKTIIGLVYECREKNKNLIGAIEIKNGELIQAKSFCNEQFRGDEREYIIRYSMRKGLGITECSDLKCDGYKEECGHE